MDIFARFSRSSQPRRICLLVSGGLDSSVLAADLLRAGAELWPLYVRCGFPWEKAELRALKKLFTRLKSPRLKPLAVAEASMAALLAGHWSLTGRGVPPAGKKWDKKVYIPGRNLVLLSQAGVYCAMNKIPWIATAVLKGNPFPDATRGFFRMMGRSIALAVGRPIAIVAPYAGLSKEEILLRVPDFPLNLAFSCLRPRGFFACGRCNKCGELEALLKNIS